MPHAGILRRYKRANWTGLVWGLPPLDLRAKSKPRENSVTGCNLYSFQQLEGHVAREGMPMTKHKFLLVHCDECGVSSPREPAELARQSGRYCLICGEKLDRDAQVAEPTDKQQQSSATR
jgi:hypothetical protein